MILIGVIVSGAILSSILVLFIRYRLHSYLALNAPIPDADILVVEGWMDDETLKGVMPTFSAGTYSTLVTVGGPLKVGAYVSPYKTLAELSAATLVAFGCDPHKIVVVPSNYSVRDRTAATATAFRDWLIAYQPNIRAINLYSHGVHARRSWLLYKKVLEPYVHVGVFAPQPKTYDPARWWHSSEGSKRILLECISLVYTLVSRGK